jgi:hypothetical protein
MATDDSLSSSAAPQDGAAAPGNGWPPAGPAHTPPAAAWPDPPPAPVQPESRPATAWPDPPPASAAPPPQQASYGVQPSAPQQGLYGAQPFPPQQAPYGGQPNAPQQGQYGTQPYPPQQPQYGAQPYPPQQGAYGPSAGIWPPPPMGAQPYEMANTSGTSTVVPPEISSLKWNWGAFTFSWIWCMAHRMTGWGIGILVLGMIIPFFNLGASIWLGSSGHKLAWQNRRFDGGVQECLAVQHAWFKWAMGFIIAVAGLYGIIFMIGFVGALTEPSK